jgi:hypothetical protein
LQKSCAEINGSGDKLAAISQTMKKLVGGDV